MFNKGAANPGKLSNYMSRDVGNAAPELRVLQCQERDPPSIEVHPPSRPIGPPLVTLGSL
jgi:hypothetical protein